MIGVPGDAEVNLTRWSEGDYAVIAAVTNVWAEEHIAEHFALVPGDRVTIDGRALAIVDWDQATKILPMLFERPHGRR